LAADFGSTRLALVSSSAVNFGQSFGEVMCKVSSVLIALYGDGFRENAALIQKIFSRVRQGVETNFESNKALNIT
jgi:hypothetical protein